jgi:hypothetical protein
MHSETPAPGSDEATPANATTVDSSAAPEATSEPAAQRKRGKLRKVVGFLWDASSEM